MPSLKNLALTAVAASLLGAVPAQAEIVWNMPTPYAEADFHTINVRKFAKDVEDATGGDLKIVVHSAGSLVKHPEIKNAIRSNQVPIGEFFLSLLTNENPVFGVDSLPFLATDYDQAEKLWKASRPVIEKLLAKQRIKILYSVAWPPQGFYTKFDATTPGDLKGLKMRAYNALQQKLARELGMVPTQVEVPDIPQAFATGQVAAMMTSPATGASSKAWDFVKYYYDVQAWLPKNVIAVNVKAFDALPKKDQAAVLKAAAAAEKRGWDMSKAETVAKTKILKDNGMVVQKPSEALKAAFKAAGKVIVADWLKQGGAEAKAILDAYNKM
ncbi:MAG: TRAP transporter substrate-binding protein [Rhodospirillaceae bacterium]